MSIEQKIAELMEEAKKLEQTVSEEIEEVKAEEVVASEEVVEEVSSEEVSKIDLGSLFEGEEFTEDFKSKAAELFEAAVAARVKQEMANVQKSLEEQALTESEELKEGLVDKVDGYLDYVVEQWMQNNELALDRGIKAELFESFVSGMKGLFEEHYINVPEQELDVLESLDEKASELEKQLEESVAKNAQYEAQLSEIAKQKQIEEASKGLSVLESERFKQLAEELAYDDEETFAKKLELVIENFVKAPKAKSTVVESVVTDAPVELKEEATIDPIMARYVSALGVK
jgi:hypothetical protein